MSKDILAYLEKEFVPFVLNEQVLSPPKLGVLPARYGKRVIFFSIIELMRRLGADEKNLKRIVRANEEKWYEGRSDLIILGGEGIEDKAVERSCQG